jgi:hypothetical protein
MNEDRLTSALTSRAESVEVPPDALLRIWSRIAARHRWRWLLALGVGLAVATAAAVVAVVALAPDHEPGPSPAGTAGTAGSAASTTANPNPTPSPSPQSGTLVANIPVYYAGGARLFREYHDLKVSPDTVPGRVAAAVTEMLRPGSPADPDYATLWPTGIDVRQVRIENGVAVVDLTSVGPAPNQPPTPSPAPAPAPSASAKPLSSATLARLAVQQLVWTVAAAVADTPIRRVDGVRLLVAGAPVGVVWGVVDAGAVLRQDPEVEVLAPVWLVEPHQAAQVGKAFTVHIAGTVLEATVRLRVRSSAGAVVKDQAVTLDAGAPSRGEAMLQLTLPPGRYTVEAFYLSAQDGGVQGLDDHNITVR